MAKRSMSRNKRIRSLIRFLFIQRARAAEERFDPAARKRPRQKAKNPGEGTTQPSKAHRPNKR
jgi:hypothetical protein